MAVERFGPPLPDKLKDALQPREQGIDSSQFLHAITRHFGGVDRLAADMKKEYDNATSGSLARQKFLDMIQRLIVQNTEREQSKIRRPPDMTTEELELFVKQRLNQLLGKQDVVEEAKEAKLDGAPEQSDVQ